MVLLYLGGPMQARGGRCPADTLKKPSLVLARMAQSASLRTARCLEIRTSALHGSARAHTGLIGSRRDHPDFWTFHDFIRSMDEKNRV